MTEKRFTYDNGNLFDNKMNTFYPIEDSDENIELLCDRLNWLVEENERLKEYNNKLMTQPLLFDVQTIPNTMRIMEANTQLEEANEQLNSFKNDVCDLIDELIKKAEKDVEDLRKDAYEKGYAYNPYYYWGVAHGLKKLKKELEND